MFSPRVLVLGAIGAALVSTVALAASHGGNPAVKARQAHMSLQAYNLGIVGAMAQGKAEYDAEAASAAAENLAALTKLNMSSYWAPGTSNADIMDTRALPAIWEDLPGVMGKIETLRAAADTLAADAGNGLDALKAALGPVGGACGACHEAYRAPNN